MKFEILTKEFKTLTEKAATCILKKAPALVTCGEYQYLLLPVNLNVEGEISTIEERINKLIA